MINISSAYAEHCFKHVKMLPLNSSCSKMTLWYAFLQNINMLYTCSKNFLKMCDMVCEQLCFFCAQSHFLSVTIGNILISYRCRLDTQREPEDPHDVCTNCRQQHINTCLPSLKFGYLKLFET